MTGNDAYEVFDLVAGEHNGFEHLMNVFAQFASYGFGTKIVFVNGVRHQLIGDMCLIEQAGNVGFFGHGSKRIDLVVPPCEGRTEILSPGFRARLYSSEIV